MANTLHRNLKSDFPTVVGGQGLWLRDDQGKEYLDAVSGGAAVSCLGHGNLRVAEAITEQLSKIAYAHGSFFTSEPAEALSDTLLRSAPTNMGKVLYTSGGSEAIEAALKLVRQIWIERGRPKKSHIISRRQSYHGATIGALSIGGNLARREIYAPYLFHTHFIDPCYAYRHQDRGETIEAYGQRAANCLEQAIIALGPETVAAFVAEPVVGATLGCVPAVAGYLRRIREICDRYDVLFVLDEIMCGTGRTGYPYACLEDGVSADIITIAKGLGGGYQPIGAVLVASKLVDVIRNGTGTLKHGFTYMGHPVACAAALAVQTVIAENNLLANVRTQGALFRDALEQRLGDHVHIGDIRGRGLFIAVELVRDRSTKAPFDPELAIHARVKAAALERGLMVYPGSGTVDGRVGDHILFAPAYTVSTEESYEIVDRFVAALNRTCEGIRPVVRRT